MEAAGIEPASASDATDSKASGYENQQASCAAQIANWPVSKVPTCKQAWLERLNLPKLVQRDATFWLFSRLSFKGRQVLGSDTDGATTRANSPVRQCSIFAQRARISGPGDWPLVREDGCGVALHRAWGAVGERHAELPHPATWRAVGCACDRGPARGSC